MGLPALLVTRYYDVWFVINICNICAPPCNPSSLAGLYVHFWIFSLKFRQDEEAMLGPFVMDSPQLLAAMFIPRLLLARISIVFSSNSIFPSSQIFV